MNQTILNLINKYEQPGDFNHATVTEDIIHTAENELGVKLPEQYKEFIINYGHGGIGGMEILGMGLTGRLIFVDTTVDYRKDELPENLVVIEIVDEYLTCLDCNTEKVVSWDYTGYIKEDYDSFDDYLLDQMNNAIENL